MITIQEAATLEWSAVADITKIANEQYAVSADPQFWQQYEVNTRSLVLTEHGITRLVAREDDEILASVVYCPPYEREMAGTLVRNPHPEFRLLSVLPEHRNRGLAGLLIEECEMRAESSGAHAITLHTTALMTVAMEMYKRRGYERFPEIDFHPTPDFSVWGYIKYFEVGAK